MGVLFYSAERRRRATKYCMSLLAVTSSTTTPRQRPGRIHETDTNKLARREQKYVVNISQECHKRFDSQEKENREPDPMSGAQGSSSLAPLANQQVASMRRELEAEQETRGQHRASSPGGGARYAPQMGYAQAHGEWREGNDDDKKNNLMCLSSASLGRLQLDTEPYESPFPSQRSTLRRDSHILAEISEMDSTFTSQESVRKLLNTHKRFL